MRNQIKNILWKKDVVSYGGEKKKKEGYFACNVVLLILAES